MKCPNCEIEVSKGTAICPSCDSPLDAGVEGESDAKFGEKTGLGDSFDAKPGKAEKKAPPPRDPRKAGAVAVPEAPRRRRGRRPVRKTSAEDVINETWGLYRSLPPFEQLSIAALLAAVITMLFPWKVADGAEEIGIFEGTLALIPIAIIGAAIFIRNGQDLRGFTSSQLSLGQLFSGLFLLLYCAFYFYQTVDAGIYHSTLGELDLKTSSPEIGCIACGIAGLALAAGGAWGYVEERGMD